MKINKSGMSSIAADYENAVYKLNKAGQKKALITFREAATRVPAYKDFLKKHDINPKLIKRYEDFTKLPLITKDNYLRQYPLRDLTWDGNEFGSDLISVSSGSTGDPFFWLRDRNQHAEAAEIYYDIYKNAFSCNKTPTLLVVCFSMGIWIAGSYTTLGGMAANKRGLKINIATPALDIMDAIAVITRLQKDYQQIILAGYPPFLKDLVDKGVENGVNWRKLKVGFTAAGEAMPEELRDYFIKNGTSYNDPTKIMSIYGTVDAGIVAYETPLSIILRRAIYKKRRQKSLFGQMVLPTLAQYNPLQKYIEEVKGNIVFTSSTAIPLVRYDIKDSGGTFSQMTGLVGDSTLFLDDIAKYNLDIKKWARPFVYVHGRKDHTASLYAVLIYPENIKKALLQNRLSQLVSGRFVMDIKHKRNMDQYLEIVVELRAGVKPSSAILELVRKTTIEILSKDNSEYRKLKSAIGSRATPKIILKETDNPDFFSRVTNKQRWTAAALKNR